MAKGCTNHAWYRIEAYLVNGRDSAQGAGGAALAKAETVWSRSVIETMAEAEDCGDYRVDCERGRAFAAYLVTHMAAADLTPMLGAVCRGIIEAGSWKSIHAGFFQCLAERCLAAPE